MFQPNRGKTGGGGPPQTGVPTSMQNQSCPSDMQAKEKFVILQPFVFDQSVSDWHYMCTSI
jgi:hypothetical protein